MNFRKLNIRPDPSNDMSSAPWYPVKKMRTGKRSICPLCDGWGQVTDQKTENKRTCLVCSGLGRLKPKV